MDVTTDVAPEMLAVDGIAPKEVWLVETEEQVSDGVKKAYEVNIALIPFGNGTKRHIGLPPSRYDVAIVLRPLKGVMEYSPEDLVVIVKAGTTLSELQQILSERRQFLPLDPPFPDKTTIGGIIATAMTGPSRCVHGAVREHLLGIKVVQPDGTVTRFGGKVVKNVAGYDMTKLYVGSFGTLGVILEAAFKVRPLPETRAILPLWSGKLETIETFLSRLVLTQIAPSFAELLNSEMLDFAGLTDLTPPPEPYCLLLGFEGFREEMDWWLAEAKRLADECNLVSGATLQGDVEEAVRAKVRDAHAGENAILVLKALLPSSEVCAFSKLAQEVLGEEVGVIAHSLNGIVRAMVQKQSDEPPTEAIQTLLQWSVQKSGNMVVEKAPAHWKPKLPVWGMPTDSWQLMKRVKETLDPLNIFSPGRMF